MLQNRVDPRGNIIITPARGAWMGNRGQLHDHYQHLQRNFKLKAWLICLLQFKGRKRHVMAPNRYTELFFLDEATAFAAGHRPCFECRREAYHHFKSCWLAGNPTYGFDDRTSIRSIDDILHSQRMDSAEKKITCREDFKNLPDGTFIRLLGKPYLIANKLLFPWSPSGYDEAIALPKTGAVTVLTPKSTVNAFRAGYQPQMAFSINRGLDGN
jgi:hypothetical protein